LERVEESAIFGTKENKMGVMKDVQIGVFNKID